MRKLSKWAALCLFVGILGCGSSKTEKEQTESNEESQKNADVSALSMPFEALPSQPRFQLSNLRFSDPNTFTVDWQVTSGQAAGTWSLAVIPGGNSIPTSLNVPVYDDRTSGEISGELQTFAGDNGPSLESSCEMFLTTNEAGHTFKLSNSITSGSAATTSPHPVSQKVIAQIEEHQQQRKKQQEVAAQNTQPPTSQPSNPLPTRPRPQNPRSSRVMRPPGLAAVPPNVSVPEGTKLMARSRNNEWTAATVVGSRADGFVKVHWELGNAPDEFLHRAKLAIEPATLAKLRAGNK